MPSGASTRSAGRAATPGALKRGASWFACGLHSIADARYEVPRASVSEAWVVPGMLEALSGKAPETAGRRADSSTERGLDKAARKQRMWDRQTLRRPTDTRPLHGCRCMGPPAA